MDVSLQVWAPFQRFQKSQNTLERDEDCDKTLVDHLEDMYFDLLGQMEKYAPIFIEQFGMKKDKENEEREFRKKGKFKI